MSGERGKITPLGHIKLTLAPAVSVFALVVIADAQERQQVLEIGQGDQ